MEGSANFIPLGGVGEKASFDQPMTGKTIGFRGKRPGDRGPKVIGATKEERSRIAREIRLAAKKEKKKAKSDAKKARKLNGILTRRATRNPEKYNKNKERNRLHAIDVERYKIRLNAIKQAEQLAAIHDPSGESFNVGAVVLLEDGTVKSKRALERKKSLTESGVKGAKKEKTDPEEKSNGANSSNAPEGHVVNPERAKLLEEAARKPHISKNALKKKAMYEPKPVPPKPIIPDGVEIPEGDENWLKLWDISDGDIEKRLHSAARKSGDAKRELRKKQKEEARFRRMMKQKRRNAMKMGVPFDPVQAKLELLGEDEDGDDDEASDSDDDSGSGSDSDSDSGSDNEAKDKDEKTKKSKASEKGIGKHKFNLDEQQLNAIVKREQQRVKKEMRRQERAMGLHDKVPKVRTEEEAAALKEARKKRKEEKKIEKRAKKEAEEKEGPKTLKGKENKKARKERRKLEMAEKMAEKAAGKATKGAEEDQTAQAPRETQEDASGQTGDLLANIEKALEVAAEAIEPAGETKEERRARKEKKRAEKAAKAAAKEVKEPSPTIEETVPAPAEDSKKRKRSKEEKESKKEHKRKKPRADEEEKAAEEPVGGQWNADALDGDDERKSKFLRLLGAGKNGTNVESAKSKKEGKGKKDIQKVQSELERQYETGMKMKHDGGAKRRGLGA